jgi:uncharacterized protein YndB with AHSA1/START domain
MTALRVSKDLERREITLERELGADPERVWRSWTNADELESWWGPEGWVTTVRTLDVRPGGLWHFGMGPAASPEPEVWIRSIYSEVIVNAALAYVEGFSDATGADLDPDSQAVTVEFFGIDPGRTRLVLRTRFSSLARLEYIASMGMVEGWTGGFDRLDRHLTKGTPS